MPTAAEFLKSLGERLARFERHRVAKAGCSTALGLLAVLIGAAAAGLVEARPIFPRFFRLVTLAMLGGILLVFALFAALETAAERRALREVDAYLAGGGAGLATLLEMARARRGRFEGSEKVIEILERAAGRGPSAP